MGESSWVHERPASTSFRHLAVIPQKPAAPALETEENACHTTPGHEIKKQGAQAKLERDGELTIVQSLALVWPETLIRSHRLSCALSDSPALSLNLNLLNFFLRVVESFCLVWPGLMTS